MPERYRSIVDVRVILERGPRILLLQRQGAGYGDGPLRRPRLVTVIAAIGPTSHAAGDGVPAPAHRPVRDRACC